uniref:Glycosyltransferase n=1 Tax=Camellia sinensis TaxID=4442 RepID=A0A0X9FCX9_CAMSI|nr:UDP-glycosyltransferase 74AG1 [Camellia sinensis]
MAEETAYKAHVMVLPFYGQGHLNPMLQFSKRLASKGLKVTVTTIHSVTKTMPSGAGSIAFESVYDDSTDGGFHGPGGFKGYLERFEASVTLCLTELIKKLQNSEYPVKCLVYDGNLPWALNIAKQLGIAGATFFTQSCAAIAGYYPMHLDSLGEPMPVVASSMLAVPELKIPVVPTFESDTGRYPPIIRHILQQFSNIEKADWVLFNSFDKLEEDVMKWMADLWPVRAIGPTVPSIYLDKRVDNDSDYGFHLFKPQNEGCLKWLNTKDTRSVVYVSYGSVASLNAEQMAEMAEALKQSNSNFLWVVRATEESKLPSGFVEETSERGLIVTWCPQLEVLAHHAVGCFITHCGWNSTVEAVSFGVPVVAMPQFLDQTTNAHFLEQVWGVGVVAKVDEKGIATKEEIERCIGKVMKGKRGREIKKAAMQWKELAKEAVDEGGSSDKYIDEIITCLAAA